MHNRDTTAAWAYHNGTKHSFESVRSGRHYLDWNNKPLPFKVYRTLEPMPLPTHLPPPSSVPALDAIASAAPDGDRSLDLEALAQLLYLSAGVVRRVRHGDGEIGFRAAACTGALYHIELYLACADLPELPAGLYHFSPADFALRRLRGGDWRGELVEATGREEAIASSPVVVIVTSTFWRNAWKYQERAYRHAFWDSGTLLANLLAGAVSSGLPARLALGFSDGAVNRLIDVDGEREAAVGLVALGRSVTKPPPHPSTPPPLNYETVPLSRSEIRYPEIVAMHLASTLHDGSEAAAWRDEARPAVAAAAPSGRLFPLQLGEVTDGEPLEAVIRRRGSTRRFAPLPITFAQLSLLLDRATRGISADFLDPAGAGLTDLYLIVQAVEGLPPGAYRYHQQRKAIELLQEGPFRREAGYLALEQQLAADAAVNIYMLTDLRPVLERFGNRGYRAAQIEGGIIGGKCYLAAYAQHLGCTGLTFYDDDVTRFFSPHAAGKSVMFLVAVGRSAVPRTAP